jgi:hypothetical protein
VSPSGARRCFTILINRLVESRSSNLEQPDPEKIQNERSNVVRQQIEWTIITKNVRNSWCVPSGSLVAGNTGW